MNIYKFDRENILNRLESMDQKSRVVFATACAERLFPAYEIFNKITGVGDSVQLRNMLDKLWDDLNGKYSIDDELSDLINICTDLVPDEDDPTWVIEQPAGSNAGVALAYALMCRQDYHAENGVWPAQCAYEAIDYLLNIGHEDYLPDDVIFASPIMQAELSRQLRDLDDLARGIDIDVIHKRAVIEKWNSDTYIQDVA